MQYIDYSLAMEYLGNNERLFKLVSDSFLKSYVNFASLISNLFANKEHDKAYHEIHNLKGITLNLGAEKLYNVTQKLLDSIKENNVSSDVVKEYLDVFNDTYLELSKKNA